jgi:hypothetical protein
MSKFATKEYWVLLFLSITIILVVFFSVSLLQDNVIGMIDCPGAEGEILFQRNIIYNFERGNLFNYFNTDYLNYPFGENLGFALANSFHLFTYIPLRYFLGTVEAYNALVMIIFFLNFLAAYILAKYLFSSKAAALCSALVFAVNPYVFLKMNLGFIQKYTLFLIPLYCLSLFKLQDTKKWRYVFAAGIILTLMQLIYPPYACFALIFTIPLLSYLFFKRNELRFAISRLVSLLAIHFIISSLIYYLMGFGFVYFQPYKLYINTGPDGCLDLFRPFKFFPYCSPHFPTELPLGLSISAIIIGMIALIKKNGLARLVLINLLFFMVIAAGPYLIHNGKFVYFFGKKVTLPFYIITKYIPLAGGIFFPIRVFPFINICLAILTGYGLLYLFSNFRRLKPLSVAAIFLVTYLLENLILFPQLFPPRITKLDIPVFYEKIKNENFNAVLNLPVSSDRKSINNRKIINRYGYYAAISGKKMMNPYSKNELQIYLPENIDNQQAKENFIEFLSDWQVGYVIIHRNFLPKDANGAVPHEYSWLKEFCELVVYPDDNIFVYRIPLSDEVKLYKKMIYVPKNYPSIQQGIDAAGDGDTLLVDPGKYKGCIDFRGKRITVRSKDGPKTTIVDGGSKGSVVVFNSGEDERSILEGFTICNGRGTPLAGDDPQKSVKTNGGGIICVASSPQIINNIIENNTAENGGGICCLEGSSPLIKNNIITRNKASKGAGIRCSIYSSPIITANKIFNNGASRLGGGIYWRLGSYPVIKNNIIVNNSAGENGGGLFGSSYVGKTTGQADVIINYCFIKDNNSPVGPSIALGGSVSKVIINHCRIKKDGISDPEKTMIWLDNNS